MKVILTKDVPGFGNKNDIKEAKPGYWRNFLVPRNLAVLATPELVAATEKSRKENAEKEALREKGFEAEAEKIKGESVLISALADEKGSLFAGIGPEEISFTLKEKFGSEIPPARIKMEKPIKEIGVHEIPVGNSFLKIEVVREEKTNKKETTPSSSKKKVKTTKK